MFVSSAVYSDREPFLTADMAGFRKTIDVSMFGAYYCLRACCNQMIKQGQGGSAVIVSSPHAKIAFPNAWPTTWPRPASTRWPAPPPCELLPHKIRVNICYPGWTDTPGERKFFTEETIQKAGKSTAVGPAGDVRGDRPRRSCSWSTRRRTTSPATILHIDGGLFLPWWSKRDDGGLLTAGVPPQRGVRQ